MSHRNLTLCFLALLVGCAPGVVYFDEAVPVGLEENLERGRVVLDGVAHHQTYQWEEPWFVNWAEIDLTRPDFAWRALTADDRVLGNERLSAMAQRVGDEQWSPVAAINADFWASGGRSVGLGVFDGRLLTLGNGRPATVLTTDGVWHIDRFNFDLALTTGGMDVAIDDVNRIPEDDAVIVHTAAWGTWPPAEADGRAWSAIGLRMNAGEEFGVNDPTEGTLVAVGAAEIGAAWPDDLLVLVGWGDEAGEIAALTPGQHAMITVACEEFAAPVDLALGGGPVLLRDGEVVVTAEGEPGFRASFVTDRHPRSVIGVSADQSRMILMVIDGRQPGLSRGMSLLECAAWMREHGMSDAMNFDGGGSSSLWVAGQTVSAPSDAGGERSVTNGLFLLTEAAVPVDEEIIWTRDADESFDPALIEEWEMFPGLLDLSAGEEMIIHPRARDADGARVHVPREVVTLSVEPAEIAEVTRDERDRLVVHARAEGRGRLVIQEAQSAVPLAAFPLTVGHWELVSVEGFESGGDLPASDLIRFDATQTRSHWTSEITHGGAQALQIDYAMEHGGVSAAYFHLETPLPIGARHVGLWVFGDGGASWMRGIVTDADGEKFLVDFTNGTQGISWTDEWRWVLTDLTNLRAHWDNPDARPNEPLTLATVYLAQTREASKTSGRVVFDDIGVDVFSGPSSP